MASSSRPASVPDAKLLLALFGPTASGKTAVAGELLARHGFDVISADSAAVYEGLPILTAAPDYPAALVGVVPLAEDVSVGRYAELAHRAIDASAKPLLVGGTGLYFRAAIGSLALPPPVSPERRAFWRSEVGRLGPDGAHALLLARDPAAAARVHRNDTKRLVRALELSEAGSSLAPAHDSLWSADTRVPTVVFALDVALDELDARIERRTREMAARGAIQEATHAWSRPLSTTAQKVLGLAEFATLPEDEAVDAVVVATRRFARYQRKWLRRLPGVVTLDGARPPKEIADEIVALGRSALERPGEHLPRHD